jgi:hypothetical protein
MIRLSSESLDLLTLVSEEVEVEVKILSKTLGPESSSDS